MCICIILILVVIAVSFLYNSRYKLYIQKGMPADKNFYKGWNNELLTKKWLKVSSHVTVSLFCQDPEISYYGVISDKVIGVTGTTKLVDYFKHFDEGVKNILSDKDVTDDDKKFVRIYTEAENLIRSYVKDNSLNENKLYHNSGLMVTEAYWGKGIGAALMRHKLNTLNSIVFTVTTNKYSAKVMKVCGFKLIKRLKYTDFDICSDDTFNVYVWTPEP